MSDAQWAALEEFFSDPGLRAIILCSETPFLGDEPDVCREKVEGGSGMDFLRDHWPYNKDELIRLLDMCFAWKSEGEESGRARDILLLGGDIHCGVTRYDVLDIVTSIETGYVVLKTHLTFTLLAW